MSHRYDSSTGRPRDERRNRYLGNYAMTLAQRVRLLMHATAIAAFTSVGSSLVAQPTDLPFQPGERLTYRVRVSRFGTIGTMTMSVEGPTSVRDVDAYLLRFDLRARVGFITATDRTASWIDPTRMVALRFHKYERHLLAKHDERVELFPEDRRWERSPADAGVSPTDAPLDELSFMYFVRTLPLVPDTTYELTRHFEPGRNPIVVRVVRREQLETPAGSFPAVLVELHVKDPRRYRGTGVIHMHLSDDSNRLPLRITSVMPLLGATVLSLVSYTQAPQPTVSAHP